MTIAISLKVNDGLVLAADSASTITSAQSIINVYDNTNKVFNLHKSLPVGVITWGSGSIGNASIATLVKDFRSIITSDLVYKIDCSSYTIKDIADKFFDFIYNEYTREFATWNEKPELGFIIGGYSSGAPQAETWLIDIKGDNNQGPQLLCGQDNTGLNWFGQPEAIWRIVKGFSPKLIDILHAAGVKDDKIKEITNLCLQHLDSQIVIPPMPIQDVIDIAYFLIDTTTKFVKYSPGAPTVGGPIEIAAITKHEGFKWVQRKCYFSSKLNPKE